jgi:hypothetical protein
MNTMNFYDQWIDLAKKNVPSLENQEEMTASIMQKIENLPADTSSNKIRNLTTFLSGMAACFLFCLLIYEFNRPLMIVQDRLVGSTIKKSSLPEKIEDIPNFLREKERRATVYSEFRQKLVQNHSN